MRPTLPILAAVMAPALSALATELSPAPPAPGPDNPLSFANGVVTFDFQSRTRWEIRENNFDFNSDVRSLTDDNWFLFRNRIGLAVRPASWLTFYVQGQDAREWLSDRPDIPNSLGAEGDDSIDVRQAYVELGDAKGFSARLGRQVLAYGDERLIGQSDWTNFTRTFDAIRLHWGQPHWWIDAFASSVVVIDRGSLNHSDLFNGNENDRHQIFSGLYFSTDAVPVETTDVYLLHLHENANPRYQQNTLGDTNFFTLGLRVKSKPGAFAHQAVAAPPTGKDAPSAKETPPAVLAQLKPIGWDYELEAAGQSGHVRGMDLNAAAVHVAGGYTFDTPSLIRLGLEYNFATGDNKATDQEIETFQNLFPTNHKFYGFMDLFGWQNIHDAMVEVKAQPFKGATAQLAYHAFWLATNEDAWYRANASAVRPVNAVSRDAGKYVGSEIDLVGRWAVSKHLTLEAGYCHFFAGEYVKDTGPSDDADFGYVQTTISF